MYVFFLEVLSCCLFGMLSGSLPSLVAVDRWLKRSRLQWFRLALPSWAAAAVMVCAAGHPAGTP